MDRTCKNHPNRFCYIYEHVVLLERQAKITDFVKKAYQAYFGVKLGDPDKPFAPHIYCKTYVEIGGIGGTRKGIVCHLVSQWCGGKGKIMLPIATFT